MARRFLFAGLGGVGQRHLRNLRTLLGEEAELLAYRTRRDAPVLTDEMGVESGGDLESKYRLRVFTDLSEALAERPEAVIISNPTSLHLPVARAAAEAGCHLFIEKPVAHEMDGVPELIEIIERKQLVSFVGYQWRFHPCLAAVRKVLEEGVIGRVVAVRARFGEYLPGWHPYEDYRQSYAARRELGGGVLLTQIHDFDYLGWLFDWPRRVFCVGGKLSNLEIDVEDTASTLMECELDGRTVPIHLLQDYLTRPGERGCEIVGETGKIHANLAEGILRVWTDGGRLAAEERFDMIERNQIFLEELRHFLGCLQGAETSRVTAREGARSLQVALAARESLSTGRVVDCNIQ
ncbi:MAG: Gfo/Idh/MocA family oxidoreductase [Chthoniobacterales bacterium]|nr:Gfo/Idh/MocA family oxidoreductase [Chthoniobacterales bacterium]